MRALRSLTTAIRAEAKASERARTRLPKRRRESLPDLARELSAEELVRLTGAHISTARRWRQFGTMPPVIARALALVQQSELGALHAEWQGWRVNERGELVSPEGWQFTPGDLRATRVLQRNGVEPGHDFEREREEVAAARERVLSAPERVANVTTLIRLDKFARRIRKEIRRATERLHPAEQERLWWESGARERALQGAEEGAQIRAELGAPPEKIAQARREHPDARRRERKRGSIVVPDFRLAPPEPLLKPAGWGARWLRAQQRARRLPRNAGGKPPTEKLPSEMTPQASRRARAVQA
jgi:Phage protein